MADKKEVAKIMKFKPVAVSTTIDDGQGVPSGVNEVFAMLRNSGLLPIFL
jgi:hypothetical protein